MQPEGQSFASGQPTTEAATVDLPETRSQVQVQEADQAGVGHPPPVRAVPFPAQDAIPPDTSGDHAEADAPEAPRSVPTATSAITPMHSPQAPAPAEALPAAAPPTPPPAAQPQRAPGNPQAGCLPRLSTFCGHVVRRWSGSRGEPVQTEPPMAAPASAELGPSRGGRT
jgi:hypothetical protein